MTNASLLLLAGVFLLGCGAARPTNQAAQQAGEPTAPLPWNTQADRQNCPVSSDAVWVAYRQGQDCIRYFAGGQLEGAPVALVVLRGDRDRLSRRRPEDIRANTAREQEAIAERLAQQAGVPVLVVARPGTYGSSGNHAERRQQREFLALNAAFDAIRARHRIGRFIVFGHSGGATAAAALLTMGRTDISCAVLTSGAYSLIERARMVRAQQGRQQRRGLDLTGLPSPYDPLDHVGGVVRDQTRMVFVIGNEKDRVTPFILQRKFAEALRRRGHKVRVINHPAIGPSFHDLKDGVGMKTATDCARGAM